jgi:hypothetical protein
MGLCGTSGPPRLNQAVLFHSFCCNAIHGIASFHVFTFQVDLLLVRSITVASYTVFLSNIQTLYMVGY